MVICDVPYTRNFRESFFIPLQPSTPIPCPPMSAHAAHATAFAAGPISRLRGRKKPPQSAFADRNGPYPPLPLRFNIMHPPGTSFIEINLSFSLCHDILSCIPQDSAERPKKAPAPYCCPMRGNRSETISSYLFLIV